MFVCQECLDRFEGAPIEWGKMTLETGRGSYGPCELCLKVRVCADVPSSVSWKEKEAK